MPFKYFVWDIGKAKMMHISFSFWKQIQNNILKENVSLNSNFDCNTLS